MEQKIITIEHIERAIKQWHLRHGRITTVGDSLFVLELTSTYKNKTLRITMNTEESVGDSYSKEFEATTIQDVLFDAYEFYENLCDTCAKHIATCSADPRFGSGIGNDNVVGCRDYKLDILDKFNLKDKI